MNTEQIDIEKLTTFWDKNPYYYEEKWHDISKGPAISWNWSAFLFSIFWVAYRKMYIYACLVAVILYLSPSQLLNSFIGILLGMFGNYIYIKFSEMKVKKIIMDNSVKENELKALKKNGGVTVLGPVIMLFLFLLIIGGATFLN